MSAMAVDVVFETSFEVCNKVGGIYTVVSSKAALAQKVYPNYALIGPFFPAAAALVFYPLSDTEIPSLYREGIAKAKAAGIYVHVGKWLIPGEPLVFLLGFDAMYARKNEFKKQLWDKFGVDSLNAGFDFDEPLAFSLAAGVFIECMLSTPAFAGKHCVSQTHEWMTGLTNLHLKAVNAKIKTVFTTHATMLARSMAGSGIDVYQKIKSVDPQAEARRFGVIEKFTAERACAKFNDVFTTVSDLTALEATYILGRKPDVVTQNGLLMSQFPSFEQSAIVHAGSKARLIEFLRYFFFPHHRFNLDETLLYYISGRYEFHNKGMDVTIDALGKLNERLRAEKSDKTIVTFFFVPMQQFGVRREVLESKLFFRHIKRLLTVSRQQEDDHVLTQVLEHTDKISSIPALTPTVAIEMKQLAERFTNESSVAPYSTHNLGNENENTVVCALRAAGLLNRADDRVKVVIYPVYLNGADELLDMTYYDAINGCHLGLFASFYEPWGYTPLESAALGVPCVTTTAAGFGQYIAQQTTKQEGIFVLDRLQRSDADIVREFVRILYDYTQLTHHARVKHKIAAKLLADAADWSQLFSQYRKAYES